MDNKADVAAFSNYVETATQSSNTAKAPPQEKPTTTSTASINIKKLPKFRRLTMPNLSPSMSVVNNKKLLLFLGWNSRVEEKGR